MNRVPLVDLLAQHNSIQGEIDSAIQNVIQKTSFVGGPFVQAFEEAFANYCGLSHGVGTSSGTTALHLVFAALGLGPGDEVITVPNTFIATAETITQTGARPVFVDVEPQTLNMDPSKLEAAITKHTRAIVPVHLYGHLADLDPILEIARAHGLVVVEDAAQAHGAEYKKKRAGHYGVAATFSFYPGKIMGAYGDAGIVVTSDSKLAEKMQMLANHGRLDKYRHRVPAYNYRLDGIQAAILSVKLKHLDEWLSLRRKKAQLYNRLLEGSAVQTPFESSHARHVHTYYVIRTPKRDAVQEALKEADVDTVIHYPIPLHLQPAYQNLGYSQGDFPVAEEHAERILSLPLYPELEDDQIRRIADLVRNSAE
ncbi:MAG: DegT/DnrJ/EryC1/StrS family aminotransferase [bacterium]|nr:DegT/DnrJ/EryC1/StrS family aminotransferase [bacterium]